MEKRIVVAIPCYNEELTIGRVIVDFKKALPMARILVVDNNSKDQTARIAQEAGAEVICEKRQGKGFAVQKIFDEFEGDVLVLVDGDDTYPAESVKCLLKPVINEEVEMVVGNRIHKRNMKNFSQSHWLGNKFLTRSLNFLFRTKLKDMESGFRAMDRKFVKSSALLAGGFGIEPEITIQAIEKGMRIKEIQIDIKPREDGSDSKLNAARDGTIVLYTVISLFRDYKPLQFFTSVTFVFFLFAIGLGWYSVRDYVATGVVYHIPALLVSGFFAMASFISFIAGLILSSIKRRHEELLVILRRSNRQI
jgi:glycosyltransferase involved in cell wall biosynthesis